MLALFCATFAVASLLATATPTTPIPLFASTLEPFYVVAPRSDPLNTSNFQIIQGGVAPSKIVLASGRVNYSRAELGWDYLQVDAPAVAGLPAWVPYLAGGYFEGVLTAAISGFPTHDEDPRPKHEKLGDSECHQRWMADHFVYLHENMNKQHASPLDQRFWGQMKNLWMQMEGIAKGISWFRSYNVSTVDVYMRSFTAAGAVNRFCAINGTKRRAPPVVNPFAPTHCSAMVRPTADDLFVAHDTWTGFDYGMAVRIYKVYRFGGTEVAFSGYPVSIESGDDWYYVRQGQARLGVMETTNDVFNGSLFAASGPRGVSEFARVMIANYLATDGASWVELFSKENIGDYCNQWMVTSFHKFTPGRALQPGTLWVAEQLPGLVESADVTDVLQRQGYWASYNIPYFPRVYNLSGYAAQEAEQGSFWSHDRYARATIFKRNHSDVVDTASMQRMMRYNNWHADPLSLIPNCTGATGGVCSPRHSSMLTIASRGDLLPVYATAAENVAHYGPIYGLVAQGCFGATDSKIARWSQPMVGLVVNGPSNDQVPTFNWGGSCEGHKPSQQGTPAVFDFPWLEIHPGEYVPPPTTSKRL